MVIFEWMILFALIFEWKKLNGIMGFPTSHNNIPSEFNWTHSKEELLLRKLLWSISPSVKPQYHPNTKPVGHTGNDDELLETLTQLMRNSNNTSARLLWNNNTSDGFVEKTFNIFNLKQVSYEIENRLLPYVSCTACKAGAGLILHSVRTGRSEEDVIKTAYQVCINLNIQSPRVCKGITTSIAPDLVYVLHRTTLDAAEICSFFIADGCGDINNPYHEWKVALSSVPKPPVQELPLPKEDAHSIKVLHISDTHYDPHYVEGSNANCNEPLCCRQSSGSPLTPNDAAGKWGDYRSCDTPKRTIENMLSHIAATHRDIDYIIWTGDLPPHDIWNQTKVDNLEIIKETARQMSEFLPGIPIFPALGNHESSPVNSFPTAYANRDNDSISWLYNELDEQWRKWLPSNVSHTIRQGAFYSVLVRPGLRIISLNMNYCNNKNWWLLLNSTDPVSELHWFIYELQSAEFSKEKVHVIGHIPPGYPDCLKVWSRNFYTIISRYENTVAAQFYGHTHLDEFEVFYDPHNLSRANSIAYIGPSVSPYINLNPGYRIYYVDGDHDATTRLVVDHESWIMNLKEANRNDSPIWYKLYTAKSAFNMKALRPSDWNELINAMTQNQELFDMYYRYHWKNSPGKPACDADCRKRILCNAKCGRSHDRNHFCSELEAKVDNSMGRAAESWV